MKIIFFCSYYDAYLNTFYKRNKNLASQSYLQQMTALKEDHFGHWASFVDEFIRLGVDAELIIPNCKPLQVAWANENDFKFYNNEWNFLIALEQTRRKMPDIFYISSMFEYYNDFLKEVKKYAGNIFGWINCAIPEGLNLSHIELLLTAVPHFVDNFRKKGIRSELLGSAFDPVVLKALGRQPEKDIDFSFIGSLTVAHTNRIKLIKELINKTNLLFFGTGIGLIPDDRNFFRRFTTKSIYQQRMKEPVWGLDMYRTLQRSKITFNAHIDISKEFIGNMRMYEATGVGTLLLTDGKYAPQKNFNEDEIVYYESVDDAIEKVHYYLQHKKERENIAAKGQKRTLTEYNYETSSRKLLDCFNHNLKN